MMNKFNDLFTDYLIDNLPNPTRAGLRELVHNYNKMCAGNLPDNIYTSEIIKSIKTLSKVLYEAISEKGDNSLIISQIQSVEEAISFINSAIISRVHASQYLLETKTYNLLNTDGLAKLYDFYEKLTTLFERIINRYNEEIKDDSASSELKFLIDFSVHSTVKSKLFVSKVSVKKPNARLIGIIINEQTFFPIKDTVQTLLHEVGHSVRPKNRETRNKLLRNIIIKWISKDLEKNLKSIITNRNSGFNEGYKKNKYIDEVKNHFEIEIFPIINNIVFSSLKNHIDSFMSSQEVNRDYLGMNSYNLVLNDFQELLTDWINLLNFQFRDYIYTESKNEDHYLYNLFYDYLSENTEFLRNNIDSEISDIFTVANSLFEEGSIFEDELGYGIKKKEKREAFSEYMDSLTILGLNEYCEKNKKIFVSTLLSNLKRSIDFIRDQSLINLFAESINESLADLFMIKAVKINSFDEYKQLFQSYSIEMNYSDPQKREEFGIRNCVFLEYFRIKNKREKSKEHLYSYNLYLPSNLQFDNANQEISLKHLYKLHYDLFNPIAEYLLNDCDVFPDNLLFPDLNNMSDRSNSDIKLLFKFQQKYYDYIQAYDMFKKGLKVDVFEHEINLINIFKED